MTAVPLFDRASLLVVGDVMLDEYVIGQADRVSPEAPVPVVRFERRSYTLGGAANAAANAASLGARVTLVGVAAEDAHGAVVRRLLEESRIGDGLVAGRGSTTTKTRIIANGQQIGRIDVEDTTPIAGEVAADVLRRVDETLDDVDAVLISDYAKGVVTEGVATAVVSAARAAGLAVVADPKGRLFSKYAGAAVVTPNVREACEAVGVGDESIDDLGFGVLAMLEGGAVLLTRGADGMSLYEEGKDPLHIRAAARHVYDVTGAGDTVAATLALGVASDLPLPRAAVLANAAGGIVVGKPGTGRVEAAELRAAFSA